MKVEGIVGLYHAVYHLVVVFRVVYETHQQLLLALKRLAFIESVDLEVEGFQAHHRLLLLSGIELEGVVEKVLGIKAGQFLHNAHERELLAEGGWCELAHLLHYHRVVEVHGEQRCHVGVETFHLFFCHQVLDGLVSIYHHCRHHFLHVLRRGDVFHVKFAAYLF